MLCKWELRAIFELRVDRVRHQAHADTYIVIPFEAVRRVPLVGDWIVLQSKEGRMERFAIAQAGSDQRGGFAHVSGEELMFGDGHRPVGLVVATYREL